MKRRHFIASSAGAMGALALGCTSSNPDAAAARHTGADDGMPAVPKGIQALRSFTPAAVPISRDERLARIENARRLMADNHLDAIFMEGGTSLFYYTGVHWGLSERTFGIVIPRRGEIAWVAPGFEEARARELIQFGNDVRVWQEDDSPFRLVAGILRDRGIATGRLGMEERVRFFIADGVHLEAPQMDVVSATPVTAGCRMIKSAAEIALMQRANDITITAYKAGWQTLREGMSQDELARNIVAAFHALGADGDVSVQFGKYTAFPHGARHRPGRPRVDVLREGQQDPDSARHVLQRRTHHRDLRRVRRSARGLSAHHAERAQVLHRPGAVHRPTVCVRKTCNFAQDSVTSRTRTGRWQS